MQKTFEGNVVSSKMQNTVIVEVTRRKPHPLYKRLLKRSTRFKVEIGGYSVSVGDRVKIIETRPISKGKYFKIMEVLPAGRQGIK